jgi:hypothetical protein
LTILGPMTDRILFSTEYLSNICAYPMQIS